MGGGVCVGKSNCATGRSGPPSPDLGEGGPLDPLGDLGESEHLGHLHSGNREPRGRLERRKPSPLGGGGRADGHLSRRHSRARGGHWVSAKALGRILGRRTPGCPRKEQGGVRGEPRGRWLGSGCCEGPKRILVPLGLGFPFSKIGRGGPRGSLTTGQSL